MSTARVWSSSDSNLVGFLASTLKSGGHSELCVSVIPALLNAISEISKTLRAAHHVSRAGTANAFGDDQLNVDVLSENIIRSTIAGCPAIVTASSEEDPNERPAGAESKSDGVNGERYTVAFDPLDGSSIIAPNWSVGTIIGIWEGRSALHQVPAEKQVAAVLGVYGPRTTTFIAIRVAGQEPICIEVGINDKGAADCEIISPKVQLAHPPFKTRYFAPANLRAAAEDQSYMGLITHCIEKKYTLRYSGGLVPDVVHAFIKGHGLYVSPVTPVSKAKLRRLFELCPIALVVECAGGTAVDAVDGSDILARAAEHTDERAGLICGTAEDVEMAKQRLLAKV